MTQEVRQLVQQFEEMLRSNSHHYFDTDEMELIIDYYLDTLATPPAPDKLNSQHTLRFSQALEQAIEYAESIFPDALGIRLRRAHLFTIQGRFNQALDILSDLEAHNPDDCDVQYALGTIYSALDQPRRAIQYYLKASRDGYQLGVVYGNVADEYYHMGRLEESLRYYKKALAHNPDEERSLQNLAATYDELDQNQQAVLFFQQFVKQHPYNKVGWFCLGQAHLNLSQGLEAIDSFQFALTIDDRYFDAYVLTAESYQLLGRPAEAISTLRESLDYASDPANVLFSIATIYQSQQNYQTASIYLRQATQQDPYFSEAWLHLAQCYQVLGDNDEAETLYQRALGMNRESDDFWIHYADFLIANARWDDSIELLQKGIVEADYPHPFNLRLALCYFKTNRRNMLFSILIDTAQNGDPLDDLLDLCPDMASDIEIMNIINA